MQARDAGVVLHRRRGGAVMRQRTLLKISPHFYRRLHMVGILAALAASRFHLLHLHTETNECKHFLLSGRGQE